MESTTVPVTVSFLVWITVLAELEAVALGIPAKQSALPAGNSEMAAKAMRNRYPANPWCLVALIIVVNFKML